MLTEVIAGYWLISSKKGMVQKQAILGNKTAEIEPS